MSNPRSPKGRVDWFKVAVWAVILMACLTFWYIVFVSAF